MELGNAQLLDYAVSKFQDGKYDEALEAFILAYGRGYEQEWIIENIYSCYMWGNDELFRKTYEKYGSEAGLSYEDCVLDFIPYKDGEYYIFDKEIGIFRGVFSVKELENTEIQESIKKVEFSAVGFEMDWNWNEKMHILAAAKERKIYAISHDIPRVLSYFKIPELQAYMKNVKIFSGRQEFQDYFHRNTSVYLPYVVLGKEEERKPLLEVIEQEHQYRLTPEGRNTDNVLLTIGIPTHDRGNLVLERIKNLCKMPYDAEIEFAISKHGTHYYQDEYKNVEAMIDARINYVGYDKEIGMSQNWQNVIKIAHGKFVLLVSDEDDVMWGALEHYFKLLSEHPTLGLVRCGTTVQYRLDKDKYFKKGKDAFAGGFLGQNYLSGAIYSKQIFEDTDFPQLDLKYKDNAFFYLYPHMWWQVLLGFKGDYAEDSKCLIEEGDSVWKEETKKYSQDNVKQVHGASEKNPNIIEIVATYEARLKQFRGIVELIKECEEFDEESRKTAIYTAIGKTFYLMEMVRDICQDSEEEFAEWIEKLLAEALSAMQELQIKKEDQKYALENFMMWVKEISERYNSKE